MRNKIVYSYSIKIHALGFDKLLESIFYLLLVLEAFSLQKVVKMLEEVVVGWWKVRWIWRMRQNFVAQFIQLVKHWLCDAMILVFWTLSFKPPFSLSSFTCSFLVSRNTISFYAFVLYPEILINLLILGIFL